MITRISSRVFMSCLMIILCLTNINCSLRINRIYDYKPISYDYGKGEIGAKLIGTYESTKKETVRCSPYKLLIWFESKSRVRGSVSIPNLELYDANSSSPVFRKDGLESKLEPDSFGTSSAYFSIKDLDIRYVRHKLVLNFQIRTEKYSISKKIAVYFDKDYKEYKSSDFWDMIMSV